MLQSWGRRGFRAIVGIRKHFYWECDCSCWSQGPCYWCKRLMFISIYNSQLLILLLSKLTVAFLKHEARGWRWLKAARNVRGATFKPNALLELTKVDLALDFFADQASHSTLTFLGRPLRNLPMRRDAATSKRFRCFNQALPVPWLFATRLHF